MENSIPNGVHYLIELFGCESGQIDSVDFWKRVLPKSVDGTCMQILSSDFYKFEPQGVTGFLLLSSSHISVHTWPDKGYIACDIFTCATEEETDKAVHFIMENINHKRANVKKINRGYVYLLESMHKKKYLNLPTFCNGENMKIELNEILHEVHSGFQHIIFADTKEFGKCMVIDDIMQVAEVDHKIYDQEMLKKLKETDENILILGSGDGYVAEEALRRNPNLKIHMAELDSEVISGCKKYLGQEVFSHENMKLFIGDALHYLKMENNEEKFDGVICDFTGRPAKKYEKKKFEDFYAQILSLSKKVLKKGGWVAFQAGDSEVDEKYIDGAKIMEEMMEKEFINIERSDIMIPSYGRDDAFLFGEK
jgi:spermidine synthase